MAVMACHYPCVSRLPKGQDCHELWSRMMKKAMRERMARPADDHSTATDIRNSSSSYPKITTSAVSVTTSVMTTTASSDNCSSTYTKSTMLGSHSVSTLSSNSNLPTFSAPHQSWPRHNISSQLTVTGGHYNKSAVHLSSSSSSLLQYRSDSSNLMQQRPVTRHFTMKHGASHAHAPTANHH